MTAFYLKSGSGVAEFQQGFGYTTERMVPKRSDTAGQYLVGRRWVWECTTPGTSAAAEPTWPASVTQDVTTVTSGTATFTARKPGYSSGTTANWAFATIYSDYFGAALSTGDVIYTSDAHNEVIAATHVAGVSGANVAYLSVDDSAAPPTALSAGATISTTGAFNLLTANGQAYWWGFTFKAGVGDTGQRTITAVGRTFEQCTFEMASTNTGSYIAAQSAMFWTNCYVKFAHAGQQVSNPPMFWHGGGLASGGTNPTSLFGGSATIGGSEVRGLDLSGASSSINVCNNINTQRGLLSGFKMPASWSGALNFSSPNWATLRFLNVSDDATANDLNGYKMVGGETLAESTVIKTGGANDGTEGYALRLVSTSGATYPAVFCQAPHLLVNNDTAGSPVTVSVDVLIDSASALTDKDVVLEVIYPSEASSTLQAVASSDPGYLTAASTLASSSATWQGTGGFSNEQKRTVSVTFTPQRRGVLLAIVKAFRASATIYVDPKATVS